MIERIYNLSAIYVTIRIILYLILMPIVNKNSLFINTMSDDAQTHYQSVKQDRRMKGYLSIILSICLGMILNNVLPKNIEHKQRVMVILFVIFGSMSIIYEMLWQNRFIFEERDINRMTEDNVIDETEKNDLIIYSQIYKRSRLLSSIIDVMSPIMTIFLSFMLKL